MRAEHSFGQQPVFNLPSTAGYAAGSEQRPSQLGPNGFQPQHSLNVAVYPGMGPSNNAFNQHGQTFTYSGFLETPNGPVHGQVPAASLQAQIANRTVGVPVYQPQSMHPASRFANIHADALFSKCLPTKHLPLWAPMPISRLIIELGMIRSCLTRNVTNAISSMPQ